MSQPQSFISQYIDHTLLKADASETQIEKLCAEALYYKFASVCVNPTHVRLCATAISRVDPDVKICTVVGFPLGANVTAVKVCETKQAIKDGANEVDMVINVGAIKSKDWNLVEEDMHAVVEEAHNGGAICKVILETCLLTDEEKIKACELCRSVGADFVKTSTGFSSSGATVEDVKLMRKTVGPNMGVKASGGIRTLDDANKMIQAGATRIGASAGVQIVEESKGKSISAAETSASAY